MWIKSAVPDCCSKKPQSAGPTQASPHISPLGWNTYEPGSKSRFLPVSSNQCFQIPVGDHAMVVTGMGVDGGGEAGRASKQPDIAPRGRISERHGHIDRGPLPDGLPFDLVERNHEPVGSTTLGVGSVERRKQCGAPEHECDQGLHVLRILGEVLRWQGSATRRTRVSEAGDPPSRPGVIHSQLNRSGFVRETGFRTDG